MGELLYKSGDTKAALAHYDRMAELFRPDVAVLVNDGLLARNEGQTEKSIQRFEEALRVAPHKIDLHLMLAETFESLGQTNKAILQYELYTDLYEASTQPPESLPSYLNAGLKLGDLYRQQALLSKAYVWYTRIETLATRNGRSEAAAAARAKVANLSAGR